MSDIYTPPSPALTSAQATNAQVAAQNPGAYQEEGLPETLLRHWRSMLIVPVLCGVLGWMATLPITSYFTATTTFVSDARDAATSLGSFAGVAAQLGLGVSASPSSSPQFFADVLRSRSVLATVLTSNIPDVRRHAATDSIPILVLYARSGTTQEERLADAIVELRSHSSVSVNPRTNMIELEVAAPHPRAAQLIAQRFVSVLNDFNLRTRQTQASERLRFVTARLAEARDSLAWQEEAQQYFLQSNRSLGAPSLQAQFGRIQRQLTLYQDLYATLRREYESARIAVVNDTPVITVIDSATVPLHRSSPQRAMAGVVGAMFGAVLMLALILARVTLAQLRRSNAPMYGRLLAMRDRLPSPLRFAR